MSDMCNFDVNLDPLPVHLETVPFMAFNRTFASQLLFVRVLISLNPRPSKFAQWQLKAPHQVKTNNLLELPGTSTDIAVSRCATERQEPCIRVVIGPLAGVHNGVLTEFMWPSLHVFGLCRTTKVLHKYNFLGEEFVLGLIHVYFGHADSRHRGRCKRVQELVGRPQSPLPLQTYMSPPWRSEPEAEHRTE